VTRAAIALFLLVFCTPAFGQRSRESTRAREVGSPVAARYLFNATGGDWAVPPEAPPPTVDCLGDHRDGNCGSIQFTKTGSIGVAPAYPSPTGSAAGAATRYTSGAKLSGTGYVANPHTACVVFTHDGFADFRPMVMLSKANYDTRRTLIYTSSGTLYHQICSNWPDCTTHSAGAATIGEHVACFAFDPVDGSMRRNLDGVATSNTTTINRLADVAYLELNGPAVSRVTIWSDWAASTSDMARMVRAQQAHQGTMGESITVTRSTPETVPLTLGAPYCPRSTARSCVRDSDGSVYTVGPYDCCIEDGVVSDEPRRTSRILFNQRDPANTAAGGISGIGSTWTIRGAATCTLSPDPAPDGTYTAERCTVGLKGVDDVFALATGFAANTPLATSFWVRYVSAAGDLRAYNTSSAASGETRVDLATIGSSWFHVSAESIPPTVAWRSIASGAAGVLFSAGSGLVTFDVWDPWQVEGTVAGHSVGVQASPVTVEADNVMPEGSIYLATVPANQLAIGDRGAQFFGAVTGKTAYSRDFSQAVWSKTDVSVSVNAVAGPDGQLKADRLTVTSDLSSRNVSQYWTTEAGKQYTCSGFVKNGPGNVEFGVYQGGWLVNECRKLAGPGVVTNPGGSYCRVQGLDAQQWTYVSTTITAPAAVSTAFLLYPASTATGGAGKGVDVDFWTCEVGGVASPPFESAALPMSMAATSELVRTGITSGDWCVKWRGSARDWGPPTDPIGMWQIQWTDGALGAANFARLYAANATGTLFLVVYDGAGGQRNLSWTHGFVDGSEHTITACGSRAGDLAVSVDGVRVSATPTGAGTGILSAAPSWALVGSYASTRELDGATREIVFCHDVSTPEECR